MGGQFGPRVIPAKLLADMASCRAIDNSLIARTNKYGDRGHPCLMPLSPRNFANGCPLMTTEKVGEETHVYIKFMK
jgi:hypothetical protein